MRNPNALIAMAQVAKNSNNPYETFCEYIKYSVFSNVQSVMKISEIRTAVEKEFGLYMPHNVLMKCLHYLQKAGVIRFDKHQIERVGAFDLEAFDKGREEYRATETTIIQELRQYALQYGREWTTDHTRELLIKTLDRNGLAYDIFLHEDDFMNDTHEPTLSEREIVEMLPDDEETTPSDIANQPLFTDDFFVARFIEETLAGDTVHKDYLKKICEGLMLCVGTYQLPSVDINVRAPQINGTKFFFDTKLLLRFLGCASEAATVAAAELVGLIQNRGGKIYYYPQTLQEMERAFENAVKSLSSGYPPSDDEMRLYALRIQNDSAIIKAKKASLKSELAKANIHLAPHENFTDNERIRFDFGLSDLEQYMRDRLHWDPQVINNDALAIWETHMRRRGNYNEYCGTGAQLPVFVTTNSRLIGVALSFREERSDISPICEWQQNRLPVITDIRLTCRLWSPSEHSERMSLLYLTANVVAAKRPTKRYLNSVRELAIQLGEQVPEYSEICLPAFFDDTVTDAIFKHTMGEEEKLDLNSFATSITELSKWKVEEQKEITNYVKAQLENVSNELKNQTDGIIDDAVENGRKRLSWRKTALWAVFNWPVIVTIIFSAIAAVVSIMVGNWDLMWAVLLPVILKMIEILSTSNFISKLMARIFFPKIDASISKRIIKKLGKVEHPYKDTIIQQIKEQTKSWVKCKSLLENQ